jgi:hypothetical protein
VDDATALATQSLTTRACGADDDQLSQCLLNPVLRVGNSIQAKKGKFSQAPKERVLARDAHRCRVCGEVTNVVHHRKPNVDLEEWLITLCPACHATVERLERLDRYLPPLLLTLWREKHPDAGEQLSFALETPPETMADLQAAGAGKTA